MIALAQSLKGDTFNADLIEATVQALTDEVGRLGYAFVDIQPQINKNPETLTADVTYQINEGQKVYVERIDITGNVRTLDEVIRREFRIAEGDAFNTALLRRSQQRLRNLGFFESVDMKTVQGSAPDKVIIQTKVVEKSTGELSFGAGFSTQDGVLGDIKLRERNFLGKGQDLSANHPGLAADAVRHRQLHRALFPGPRPRCRVRSVPDADQLREPVVLRRDQHRRHAAPRLSPDREPAPLGALHPARRQHPQHRRRRLDLHPGRGWRTGPPRWSARPSPTIGATTASCPSGGYFLKLDQDVAGLGGDNRFIRHEVRAEYYYSIVPDVVFSVIGNGGYIKGFGGEDVHLHQPLLRRRCQSASVSSSPASVRATSETDDKLGGNLYYIGLGRAALPAGPAQGAARFRAHLRRCRHARATSTSAGRPSTKATACGSAAGVGLSWLSPLGPLSINFAQAISKETHDETEFFSLYFGTRF